MILSKMDIKLKLTKSAYLVDNWRYTKKRFILNMKIPLKIVFN